MQGATGAFVNPGGALSAAMRPAVYGARSRVTRRSTVPLGVLNFDDESDFGVQYGVKANDTVNYIASLGSTKQSVMLTGNGVNTSATLTHDYGSVQDFRAGADSPLMKLRFYIYEGTPGTVTEWAGLEYIRLTIGDNGLSNKFKFQITNTGTNLHAGWNEVIVTPAMWIEEAGSPAWNAIQDVSIVAKQVAANDTTSVTFDHIEFFAPMDKALFGFVFDDGTDGMYEVAAYLTSKGLRATFYIVPSFIGESGYLTLAQLKLIREMGHLIANHSWSHPYWITDSQTTDQMIEEIRHAAEWMCDNGFAEGARLFALPGGTMEWDWDGLYDLLGRYVDQIRLTGSFGYGSTGIAPIRPDLLFCSSWDSTANAGISLTNIVADKTMAIALFHHELVGGTYTQADLESLIDDVVTQRDAGNIDVVTVDELLDLKQYWS